MQDTICSRSMHSCSHPVTSCLCSVDRCGHSVAYWGGILVLEHSPNVLAVRQIDHAVSFEGHDRQANTEPPPPHNGAALCALFTIEHFVEPVALPQARLAAVARMAPSGAEAILAKYRSICRLTAAVCANSIRSKPGGRGPRARRPLTCAVASLPGWPASEFGTVCLGDGSPRTG